MSGGKGGSNQTVAYYYVPVAFAVCEGPIVGIKKIWAGGNLIFDDSQPVAVNTYQGGGKKSGPTVSTSYQQFSSSTQNDVQTGGSALGPWTCYLGTETQPADPTIGEGVGYRGMAYVVFNPLNIGPGATIPPLTFEVVTVGSLAPPTLANFYPAPKVGDNPLITLPFCSVGSDIVIAPADGPFFKFSTISNSFMVSPYPVNINGDGQNLVGAYVCGKYIFSVGVIDVGQPADYIGYQETITGPFGPWSVLDYSFTVSSFSNSVTDGVEWIAFNYSGELFAVNVANLPLALESFGSVSGISAIINGVLYGPTATAGEIYALDLTTKITTTYQVTSGTIHFIITDGTNLYVLSSVGTTYTMQMVSPDGTVINSVTASSEIVNIANTGNAVISGGYLWGYDNYSSIWQFTLTGQFLNSLNLALDPVDWPTSGGTFVQGQSSSGELWFGNAAGLYRITYNEIIPGPMTLPAAVTILCERAGLTQFDVSQLPATPVNFVRGDTVTARSMLQRLSQAYFFSMVDSGGTLKFIPQGQPSQAVIPLEDLGYGKVTANAQTPFTSTRISGVDLPRSVKIRYYSAALNYDHYEQIFALESYDSGKEITLDLPLILDDTTAYNIAALACTLPHVEREQYAFTTSYKWLALEPADVVTLPFGVCRILTVKMGQKNGIPVIDFTACIDGMNALAGAGYARPALPNYQPNTGGVTALLAAPSNLSTVQTPGSSSPHPIATAPQVQQTVPNAGVPKMVLVEPPPLRSTDTGMRFYAGAYSSGNTFPGAAIFESSDGGDTYTQMATEISATSAGYANTVLGAPNATQGFYTWDTQNTVDVYMLGNGADPTPMTDLQVMNGANGAMLGQELIQFAQATLMTDSFGNAFYRLGRLLRGRRGTQWAMGTHAVGESFYPIPSALSKESYTPPMLNNAYLYKIVMAGGDLSNAPAVSYEPNGNSLLQWSVCHPLVSVDSSGDWTVTWTPRARYNGDWASGYIPTLDPDTAGWSIDVLNSGTVVRTINVPLQTTAPWQTIYTAAMQSADGFTPGQAGITFNIFQLSFSVGRGTVRSITTP